HIKMAEWSHRCVVYASDMAYSSMQLTGMVSFFTIAGACVLARENCELNYSSKKFGKYRKAFRGLAQEFQ
ncbi:hypothetical protein HK100_003611, partial [Physocladia obscura]